ncbi:DUF1080 domain-containing protein [Thalassotalea psychrophila]|uniref:DUF1080 domain-containing protein n=1 Tax=Thalassotalea psychrophila TaxID=3065647 RepID=A0ABY9TVE7_9GAMM|nr:DUF1080 domain-containing protein [Colwelliaceae bacterium SQ149]
MKKFIVVTAFYIIGGISACFAVESSPEAGWQDIFNGKNLDGWHQIGGKATFQVEDGVIVGTSVLTPKNSFLATHINYGDFILEFEAKVDNTLNSGVQFRSLSNQTYMNGRVHGYQMEMDTSARAWTGGIYDEARRKWLYTLGSNEQGRQAYLPEQWNKFRIEAVGTRLRTYVNGIATANLVDDETAKGFIALQVHSIGRNQSKVGKQVRWRNLRVKTDDLANELWSMSNRIAEINYIPNQLSPSQKAEGWKLLWDGKTTKGWRGAKLNDFPDKGWQIKDGVFSVLPSGGAGAGKYGGDIVTLEEFSDFELEIDFNITKGANSGIKYFVDPSSLKGKGSAVGLEFQILDDKNHKDAKRGTAGNRTLGSLYDLITAANLTEGNGATKRFNGIGKWNRARIVVRKGKVQHWLNGLQTLEFDRHSQKFRELVAKSKYAKKPNFGEWEKGPILLQDHGDLVHFRTIKIRRLAQVEPSEMSAK